MNQHALIYGTVAQMSWAQGHKVTAVILGLISAFYVLDWILGKTTKTAAEN